MFNKIVTVVALLFFQQLVVSQSKSDETCDTSSTGSALDLNSITKCSVEDKNSESNKISVQVTSRRRVVRKRNAVSGVNSSSATSNKLAELKKKASLVGSLDLSKKEVADKLPFGLVEEIPLFKDCQKVAVFKQEKCFKEKMSGHIRKNFRYPEKAYNENIQGRVFTQFTIDKYGEVSDLNIRGPYNGNLLEKEAERIVRKLPKFKPGVHNGKPVKVKYGVLISFKIPGKKPSNVKVIRKVDEVRSTIYSFKDVESVPQFSACSSGTRDCFNKELSKHIEKYYVYPARAVDSSIEGKITAYFVINSNGEVANIRAKGPQGTKILEDATKKLIERLPKLKPAMKNGKPVNVKYTFPINFSLQ